MSHADKCVICNVNVLATEQEIAIRCCTKCQTKPKKTKQKKVDAVAQTTSEIVIEELAAQLHEVCQAEATRQGGKHPIKEYKDASDSVKDFDRALAVFVLKREADARVAQPKPEEEREVTPINPADYWIKLKNGETSLNGKLERGGDSGRQWIYVHAWDCEGGCEFSCNPLHPFNAKKGANGNE